MTQHAGAKLASWESERAQYQGLGVLEPLLWVPDLTDIYVNAPDEVWTDGPRGLERSSIRFSTDEEVRNLAVRILSAEGRRLDASHPCASAQTSMGYRLHAAIPPVTAATTHLSIRIQPEERPPLYLLADQGMFPSFIETILRHIVASKASFLISGATGSGKTTLLNAMLELCPLTERLLLLEDTSELAPRHPHVVSLRSRSANAEGSGAVTLTDLIREALRMGPDRIVVGECRGPEVADLLVAMNTGHEGGGATIHANSMEAVPARLMALGALAGMSPDAVTQQAAASIRVVIHLERGPKGRRLRQIGLLEAPTGGLMVRPAVDIDVLGHITTTRWWSQLSKILGLPEESKARGKGPTVVVPDPPQKRVGVQP